MKKILLSSVFICLISGAFASIVHTELNPDVVIGPSTGVYNGGCDCNYSSLEIDLNEDQSDELSIGWDDVDNLTVVNAFTSEVRVIGVSGEFANLWNISGLNEGEAIGSSQQFSGASVQSLLIRGGGYSSFPTGSDVYIGVQFLIGNATHYGWIQVNFDGMDVTVKGFAYEDTPDASINAGDKGPAGIHQTTAISFSMYPNPVVDMLLVDLSNLDLNDAQLSVVDMTGKVVFTENNLQKRKHDIRVREFASGVYYLRIQNDDEVGAYRFVKH